jgi:hypothetical protein
VITAAPFAGLGAAASHERSEYAKLHEVAMKEYGFSPRDAHIYLAGVGMVAYRNPPLSAAEQHLAGLAALDVAEAQPWQFTRGEEVRTNGAGALRVISPVIEAALEGERAPAAPGELPALPSSPPTNPKYPAEAPLIAFMAGAGFTEMVLARNQFRELSDAGLKAPGAIKAALGDRGLDDRTALWIAEGMNGDAPGREGLGFIPASWKVVSNELGTDDKGNPVRNVCVDAKNILGLRTYGAMWRSQSIMIRNAVEQGGGTPPKFGKDFYGTLPNGTRVYANDEFYRLNTPSLTVEEPGKTPVNVCILNADRTLARAQWQARMIENGVIGTGVVGGVLVAGAVALVIANYFQQQQNRIDDLERRLNQR